MRVADLMTPVSEPLTHDTTLREAAAALARARLDQLPVAHEGRLIGAVGERDLVDYGLARGLNADSPVFAVMSHYIDWCYEDEDVLDIIARLADADRESLIVLTRDHRFAGVVAASAPARGGWGEVEEVEAAA
ncbi:MAG TPA: CBS domain-containing protein [Caulobacter sp.]|nr:CBS domain-containing protein [Caulobacter sp.]